MTVNCKDYFNEQGALSLIPAPNVWSWVDEDVDTRAKYLAHLAPKKPFTTNEMVACPREAIARYAIEMMSGKR